MKIEFQCKNYRLPNRLEEVVSAKLNRLDKYFPDGKATAKVVLKQDNGKSQMEVSLSYRELKVRCEMSGNTMYYIIDDILPKLERQIVKHRERLNERYKVPVISLKEELPILAPEEENSYKIAKVKKFAIQSIDVKEAAEELELVGHDFYIFVNSATGNVECVYKRKDGTVGLLQPYTE